MKLKFCSKCRTANRMGVAAEEHECEINWDGSSGTIEAACALDLCIGEQDGKYNISVKYVVSDDDRTMCANLVHVADGGKLPDHISPPNFPLDLSHHIKVMAGPIFNLAMGESKDPSTCEKIDALRLNKYIDCWIY